MSDQKLPETLSWQAPSHVQLPRSAGWYIAFSVVSLGLLFYAAYTHSLLTFITFILIIGVVLLLSGQAPRATTYKVTKTGIAVGNTLYPFKVIKKFWIIYNPPTTKTLNFETSAYVNNKIALQLGNQDPVQLKLVLSQYLTEDLEAEESITEALARKLKI